MIDAINRRIDAWLHKDATGMYNWEFLYLVCSGFGGGLLIVAGWNILHFIGVLNSPLYWSGPLFAGIPMVGIAAYCLIYGDPAWKREGDPNE